MNPVGTALAVARRDIRIAIQRWGDLGTILMFYAIVVTLFPLALSPEPAVLRGIAAAVLWIGALLATLLSLNRLFIADLEDGSLEQLALAPVSLLAAMLGKTLAHWLLTGVPLILLAPWLALSYDLNAQGISALMLTLLLGTPTLSLIGAIGAALTASTRQSGGLMALLVIPLMLPVLMFGARATDLAAVGEPIAGPLYLLGALLVLALTTAPFVSAAAIRISMD